MQLSKEWIPIQIKTFTRWIRNQLNEKTNIEINDISKDLRDGVALIELAQKLTNRNLPCNWKKTPKRNIEMVENCNLAIEMFKKDGVHIIGISGKDINDNNEKLILGLIWSLILHYSIKQAVISDDIKSDQMRMGMKDHSEKTTDDLLISWAVDRTSSYPNISDFYPYCLSMCALLDSYFPDKINYYSLDPNDVKGNARLATKVMRELAIPIYVDLEDFGSRNRTDEKAFLIQLSYAKVAIEGLLQGQKGKETRAQVQLRSAEASSAGDSLVDSEVEKIIEETKVRAELVIARFRSRDESSASSAQESAELLGSQPGSSPLVPDGAGCQRPAEHRA